jgi:hemerythrin-like metal-binding protein
METIKWSDEFSVGVAEMDKHHQKLVMMINRLIDEQKILTDPATIAELLTEMTDYAQEHFRSEEYLMSEYGYDKKDLQVKQHEEFIVTTQSFYSATDMGANILSRALLDYLSKWLVKHILDEDMEYKDFFKSKGVY